MNKAMYIQKLRESTKLTKAEANALTKKVFDVIQLGLKESGKVTFVGFGTFKVTSRKSRMGRNPKTGEAIRIASSKSVRFKAGKELRKSLSGKK